MEWNGREGKGKKGMKREGKGRRKGEKESQIWIAHEGGTEVWVITIHITQWCQYRQVIVFQILNIYSLFAWFWPIIEKNIRRKCHHLHNQEIEYSFLPLQTTAHDKNIYFEKYGHLWKCTHNRECQVQEIDVCVGLTFKIRSSFHI